MSNQDNKTPCLGCQWRRDSAPGWLGDATPEEFHACSEAEVKMPCHNTVDYDDPDWRAKLETDGMIQCRGRAVYFANRCKLPRDPELIRADPDRELVFSSRQEFIDHHTLEDR